MSKISIKVNGMTCKHCVMRVEKALFDVNSVENININIDTGVVAVEHSSSEDLKSKLHQAVENAGYSVVE